MSDAWDDERADVVTLPSGRRVRGRGLRRGLPPGPEPDLGIYLTGARPPEQPWRVRWVKWRDFWLPANPHDAADALRDAWCTAVDQRVEIACGGGVGRTGTALACLAVLDGVAPTEAVAFIRERYAPRAVETLWQRRFVERYPSIAGR
jgi:hypothetical protein